MSKLQFLLSSNSLHDINDSKYNQNKSICPYFNYAEKHYETLIFMILKLTREINKEVRSTVQS